MDGSLNIGAIPILVHLMRFCKMIKSFIWTAIFWSLFTATNSVGDAIDFMERFPWYGNSDLWHFLKYWWIFFAVMTGWFTSNLCDGIWQRYSPKVITGKRAWLRVASVFAFLLAWFIALRYIIFETLMGKWSKL